LFNLEAGNVPIKWFNGLNDRSPKARDSSGISIRIIANRIDIIQVLKRIGYAINNIKNFDSHIVRKPAKPTSAEERIPYQFLKPIPAIITQFSSLHSENI
jgi:hypothetical protein